jgi:ADP-heptose:LPS heptosyltransferase
VVTNNSGPMHIAEAFVRPQVVLYSGTDLESMWRPRRSPAVLLRRETDCSPCFEFTCPYERECLDIPPAEVAAEVRGLLRETTPSPVRGA